MLQWLLLVNMESRNAASELRTTPRDLSGPTGGEDTKVKFHGAAIASYVQARPAQSRPWARRPPPAQQGALAMRDELTVQLTAPPPAYVLVSTAGVLELEKRRPVR